METLWGSHVQVSSHTPPSIPATISYKLHQNCQASLETGDKLYHAVVWHAAGCSWACWRLELAWSALHLGGTRTYFFIR